MQTFLALPESNSMKIETTAVRAEKSTGINKAL